MKIDKKHLFIALPFMFFMIGYGISNLLIGNKTYKTPKLIGLSLYEALKLTSPHQINLRILSEKEVAQTPSGIILSQKPSPGRIIKTHQPIFVTITKTPCEKIAPRLLKESHESIKKTCHDTHIKFKTYELEYPAPSQTCIAQLPEAGDIIQNQKMILYFAKDKSNQYLMPNFINQPLDQVLHALKEYTDKISIFQGSIKITPPYKGESMIISQKPLAGSLISIDPPLTVQLEISQ